MAIRRPSLIVVAFSLMSAGSANAASALGGNEGAQIAHSAHSTGAPAILLQRPADAAFMAVPGVPSCTTIAPLRGNMATGASTLMVRMRSGCLVPNHWHTPTEELVVLQGAPLAQMKGERPVILKVGSYSQLPSGHIHRFRCTSLDDCLIFMVADAPFDIYFVNEAGATLTPEAALAAAALDDGSGW